MLEQLYVANPQLESQWVKLWETYHISVPEDLLVYLTDSTTYPATQQTIPFTQADSELTVEERIQEGVDKERARLEAQLFEERQEITQQLEMKFDSLVAKRVAQSEADRTDAQQWRLEAEQAELKRIAQRIVEQERAVQLELFERAQEAERTRPTDKSIRAYISRLWMRTPEEITWNPEWVWNNAVLTAQDYADCTEYMQKDFWKVVRMLVSKWQEIKQIRKTLEWEQKISIDDAKKAAYFTTNWLLLQEMFYKAYDWRWLEVLMQDLKKVQAEYSNHKAWLVDQKKYAALYRDAVAVAEAKQIYKDNLIAKWKNPNWLLRKKFANVLTQAEMTTKMSDMLGFSEQILDMYGDAILELTHTYEQYSTFSNELNAETYAIPVVEQHEDQQPRP